MVNRTFVLVCVAALLVLGTVAQSEREYLTNAFDMKCNVCQIAVGDLQGAVKGADASAALGKVCENLEVGSELCKTKLTSYVNEISAKLSSASPARICHEIKWCAVGNDYFNIEPQVIPAELPEKSRATLGLDLKCASCQGLFGYLFNRFGQKMSTSDLQVALQGVCTKVPAILQGTCNDIIGANMDKILANFDKKDPKAICQTLNLCATSMKRSDDADFVDDLNVEELVDDSADEMNYDYTVDEDIVDEDVDVDFGQENFDSEIDEDFDEEDDEEDFNEDDELDVDESDENDLDFDQEDEGDEEDEDELDLDEDEDDEDEEQDELDVDEEDDDEEDEEEDDLDVDEEFDFEDEDEEDFNEDDEDDVDVDVDEDDEESDVDEDDEEDEEDEDFDDDDSEEEDYDDEDDEDEFEDIEDFDEEDDAEDDDMDVEEFVRKRMLDPVHEDPRVFYFGLEGKKASKVSVKPFHYDGSLDTGGAECQICQWAVSAVEAYVSQEGTEQELARVLQELCTVLPGNYASICQNFVVVYMDEAVNYVIDNLTPPVVCSKINVCVPQPNSAPTPA